MNVLKRNTRNRRSGAYSEGSVAPARITWLVLGFLLFVGVGMVVGAMVSNNENLDKKVSLGEALMPKMSSSKDVVGMTSLPDVNATAYVLMDASSGYVIASHNKDKKLPPASLTKMMTSYLVSESIADGKLKLSQRVGVSRNAAASNFPGGSRIWLSAGDSVTVDDLQRGLVVASGNDAAIALAEQISHKESKFVELMNNRAAELGMDSTQFKNPHGLPNKEHYSTAYDMALLARALIWDYPEDYFLYREKSFDYKGVTQSNRNTLLWDNPYIDGIKTGFTDSAGYCLAASAKKNKMRLIAIVLGTKSASARTWEAQKLLSYGFQHYETYQVYKAHDVIDAYRVWGGSQKTIQLGVEKDVYLTLPHGDYEKIDSNIVLDQQITAPVDQDTSVGYIQVTLNGTEVLNAPVIAMESIEEGGFLVRLWDTWVAFFSRNFG
ncbi:MAG: D-alanyl-D-alanine carboxypeptidase family protein [Pseudomonadota bacterium]